MKVAQLLGLRGPWGPKCARIRTAPAAGVICLSGSFRASCSWPSGGLFGQSFSVALPVEVLRGLPCLGSFSLVWRVRHIEGPPWVGPTLYSARQAFDGPASLLFSCRCWLWGEGLWRWLHPLRVTQQYCLASKAAWLSSTGISHHSLLPHLPPIHLCTVNSSRRTGVAPQSSLSSSSQPLCLPRDLQTCPGYTGLRQELSDPPSI